MGQARSGQSESPDLNQLLSLHQSLAVGDSWFRRKAYRVQL